LIFDALIKNQFWPAFVIPAKRLCRNPHLCHSVQAKRDTESSIISKFWMPAFAGMTLMIVLSAITTQSRKPESSHYNMFWTPAFAGVTIILLFTVSSSLCAGQNF